MANRKIGQAGLALIKQFEGCRLTAYQCSAGVWTIGYGHTAGVHKGMKITQAQAEEYLKHDVAKFEKYVNNPSYVPFTDKLNQNQFDALVSFAFNLGQGNVKKLCTGRTMNQIPSAMQRYCKAAGKTLPGLQRRRKAEAALYNKKVESCTGATTTTVKETEDYKMNTIKKGSKGKSVKVWQIIIGTTVDGNFGSGTESMTKTWQKNHGLTADGIVGKNSWKTGLESL
ncbi:glycoside hydrolase family protein [Roseburia intestinalis]|jgi:GH24 family phage-related lysozyme (muramidase)|uniref:glycoside hydrolase family protein n=1 Tax=Roseburia intestinalis TaxID=166486 RepID=UPI0012FBFC3A|nr:glycoside hydrolase family protein [Roseburia intestinalis]